MNLGMFRESWHQITRPCLALDIPSDAQLAGLRAPLLQSLKEMRAVMHLGFVPVMRSL